MIIRFYGALLGGGEIDVQYWWRSPGRVPLIGEMVSSNGTDPKLPTGDYTVRMVRWEIERYGIKKANVYLADMTAAPSPKEATASGS